MGIGILRTFRHQSFLRYNGHGNEGDEGNEEEEGWFQGGSAPRYVREDHRWLDQRFIDEEQVWQDREQEGFNGLQEAQRLDYCHPEGQEGFGPEGLRRNQEGFSSLQEGQGALSVSMH